MRLVYANLLALFLLFPAAGRAAGNDMILGVCEHLWGADKALIDRTISIAAKARLKILRWDVPWAAVEPRKGELAIPPLWDYVVDASRRQGIESMMILDYGNPHYDGGDKPRSADAVEGFARYAEFVARHFAGHVKYFEIWNEWDGRTGNTTPGTAADYVRLVKAVYPRVKAQAPGATIVVGSLDTSAADSLVAYAKQKRTFEDVLDAPSIASFADAISIHPYVVYRNGDMQSYEGFERLLTAMVKRIRATPGLESKPIIISELGWSTSASTARGVSEADQAQYILKAIDSARSLGVAMFLIYELRDDGNRPQDTEAGFGLLRHDWQPKPVFQQLAR